MNDHTTLLARCSFCRWQAQHRGPAEEVSAFLRQRLWNHIVEFHPDQLHADGLKLVIVDSTQT